MDFLSWDYPLKNLYGVAKLIPIPSSNYLFHYYYYYLLEICMEWNIFWWNNLLDVFENKIQPEWQIDLKMSHIRNLKFFIAFSNLSSIFTVENSENPTQDWAFLNHLKHNVHLKWTKVIQYTPHSTHIQYTIYNFFQKLTLKNSFWSLALGKSVWQDAKTSLTTKLPSPVIGAYMPSSSTKVIRMTRFSTKIKTSPWKMGY